MTSPGSKRKAEGTYKEVQVIYYEVRILQCVACFNWLWLVHYAWCACEIFCWYSSTPLSSNICKPDPTEAYYLNHFHALIYLYRGADSCTTETHHWMAHEYLSRTHKNARLRLKLVTYTCMPIVPCSSKVTRCSPFHFRLIRMRHEKPTAYKWQTLRASDLCRPEGPLRSQHWSD